MPTLTPAQILSIQTGITGVKNSLENYRKSRYGNTPTPATAPINPADTLATPAPSPASSFSYSNPQTDIQRKSADYYGGQVLSGISETPEQRANRIKEQTRGDMQARIDAINNFYAGETATAREQGIRGEKRAQALNLAAGLGGSSFASAAATTAEENTAKLVKNKEAEKSLKLQEVYGIIDTNAQQRVKAEEDKIKGDMASYEEKINFLRDSGLAAVKSIGLSGIDWEQWKLLNPEEARNLKKDSQMSDAEIKQQINIAQIGTEEIINKNDPIKGNGTITYIKNVTDPRTGKTTQKPVTVSVPGITSDSKKNVIARDDGIYIIDPEHPENTQVVGKPKSAADSGFTLSPGQSRYDANGNLISTAPGGKTTGTGVETPAQTLQQQYQAERSNRNLTSVSELENKINGWTTGRGASLQKLLPDFLTSGEYRNFRSDLNTLVSNITFGELTAMREASKTGGALGQVSDNENKLLGAALGALQQEQTADNFKKNLIKVRDSITRWQEAVNSSSAPSDQNTGGGQNSEFETIKAEFPYLSDEEINAYISQ